MIENSNGDPLLLRKSLDEMRKKLTNKEFATLNTLIFQIFQQALGTTKLKIYDEFV